MLSLVLCQGKKMIKCKICNKEFKTKKGLTTHVKAIHDLNSKEYTIQELYQGKQPKCPACGKETRYVSLSFKKYCKEHAKLSMSEAGKIGGKKKQSWNKGKNKFNDSRIMKQAINSSGKGNHFYGKNHSIESLRKMTKNSLISKEQYEEIINKQTCWSILVSYSEYWNKQKQQLRVQCKKCKIMSTRTLEGIEHGSKCHKCYPISSYSISQEQVKEYVLSLGFSSVEINTKSILGPKELDIYIPERSFAIEFNGNYWHNERCKDKDYHWNKTKECQERGIQLFHIFSDEWKLKKNIVKSMIRHRLGKTENKIRASKCKLVPINSKSIIEDFFESNHISDNAQSNIAFGLFFKNELIQCVSLRRPEQTNHYKDTIEIARFATKTNHFVHGGFSRLFKEIKKYSKQNNFKQILTYCDLRFGTGKGYQKTGFKETGWTGLDYWYTDDYARYSRHLCRADRKRGITEREVAEEKNWKRIYGCGSKIYIYLIE